MCLKSREGWMHVYTTFRPPQLHPHTTFLSHSFIHGYLSCFYFLAIVNNAAMDIGVQIHVWMSDFTVFYIYAEVKLLGHTVILY